MANVTKDTDCSELVHILFLSGTKERQCMSMMFITLIWVENWAFFKHWNTFNFAMCTSKSCKISGTFNNPIFITCVIDFQLGLFPLFYDVKKLWDKTQQSIDK